MYLKSLTLRGFKSFARKTVLNFEPGITVVVGPNGSGKSNIADAVMWVLGEQRPKHLRGGKMEDVIFSGSTRKPALNMAEVVLTLDNSNSEFPFEFAEVTTSRSILRSGESEYRLNGQVCRLIDIQELLADAGIGRSLNSVVSQGQLEEVLTCRPEERRGYLEEAAGLLKFRRRKEKALRRMERMEAELVRINDITSEVKKQMRPLARQAKRLEDHQGILQELKEGKLRIEVGRLSSAQRKWREYQGRQDERKKRLSALHDELDGTKSEIKELSDRLGSWVSEEEPLRKNEYRIVSCHERLKAFSQILAEKRRSLSRLPEIPEDLLAIAGVKSLEGVEAELVQGAGRLKEMSESRDLLKERVEKLSQAQRSAGKRQEDLRVDRQRLEEKINEVRDELSSRTATLEVAVDECERLTGKLSERGSQADSLRFQLEGLEKEGEVGGEQWRTLWAKKKELENKRSKVRDRLKEIEAREREIEREEIELITKLHLMENLESGSPDYANTAAFLLKQGEGSGLEGPLISNLKVDARYERALYTYLGPWLFCLAAQDVEAIRRNIKFLKDHEAGYSLFFRSGGEYGSEWSHDRAGVRKDIEGAAWARKCVDAPKSYGVVLDELLGDCYLVDDLESAFRLSAELPELNFLTLDGDVVTGGFLAKGGSPTVSEALGILGRTRREEMTELLDFLEEEISDLGVERKRMRGALEGLEEERGELEEKLEERYDESDSGKERGSELRARLLFLEREMEELQSEIASREKEIKESGETKEELSDLLERLKEERKELIAEQEKAESEGKGVLSRLRKFEPELYSLKSEVVVLERRVEYLRELSRRFNGAEKVHDGKSSPGSDLASGRINKLEALQERLSWAAESMREKLRARLEEGMTRYRGVESRYRECGEDMEAKSKIAERLKEEIHQEEVSHAELKVRVEEAVKRIEDEHQVPLEFALKQYPDEEPSPELEERVAALARKIERLGPVNPEAIVEYGGLKERYDFLNSQVEDVTRAKSSLKKVIREIDARMKLIFSDSLEEINQHFQDIYSYLFPRGKAEIVLTDPEDILNSGIEIMGQPQGKRTRRLSLLSGGERALTAIAFFFSMFRVRPSPFYFLDEVEAALDDINLTRFLELVKMFKNESQLVLITHQKRSMEVAEVLYGVTMQEDGVSKVISQKVGEVVGG